MIQEEQQGKAFDSGVRVFYLDDGNMKDVYFSPEDYTQDLLSMLESNIKEDRNDLDLLFGCILDWGLPLAMKYECVSVGNYHVHLYNDNDLVACFDNKLDRDVIEYVAKLHPLRVVFKDKVFMDSPSKINVEEIFKYISPETSIKVI